MIWRARGGRVLRTALIFVLVGQIVALVQPQLAAVSQSATPALEVAPDRYIVLLRDGSFQSAEAAAASVDRRPGARVDLVYDTVFRGFAGSFSQNAVRDLFLDPQGAAVYPDYVVRAQGQRLEPGIDRVDADLNPTKACNGNGSVDVDVAIIDSGVGPNSDLNIAGGYDCWGQ